MLDATGLPLTCSSQTALDSFNRGLLGFVTLREKFIPWFEEASVVEGSHFPVAHSVLVCYIIYTLILILY